MTKWILGVAGVVALCAAAFFAGFRWQAGLSSAYEAPADWPADSRSADAAGPAVKQPGVDAPDVDGVISPEQLERLMALGYLSAYVEATDDEGITVHRRDRAHTSLNLYTSGHAPEAYLMDMDGQILHTWRYAFEEIWDEERPEGNIADFWRRAHLFENGDVIAIFETLGIFKVDKDSKLLWAERNSAHHDLFVHEDGRIFTLTQRLTSEDWFHEGLPVFDDYITILSPEGQELERISVLECIRNSRYAPLLQSPFEGGDRILL